MILPPDATAYTWLLVAGIIGSLLFWRRLARRDDRLMLIYVAALVGAFAGAKLGYLVAEGWLHVDSPDRWMQWATGKTILGALLGGYLAVEVAKWQVGYSATTGDWFALTAPMSIAVGRIGCLLHGCCAGVACDPHWWTLRAQDGSARWPSSLVEIAFNLFAVAVFFGLRRKKLLPGQHFHLYLIGYGLFRFAHEWARATPRIMPGLSSYQLLAAAVFALGLWGFLRRQRGRRSYS